MDQIPKSYAKLDHKELRHRAGLAWKDGKMELAQHLEAMAAQSPRKYKPGQHGVVMGGHSTSPLLVEHHVTVRGFRP